MKNIFRIWNPQGMFVVLLGDPEGGQGERKTRSALFQMLLVTEFTIKEERIPRPHSPLTDSKVLVL
jgi:hypothetical protein